MQTAEGQRRRQIAKDQKRQREANLQSVAYFDGNDEMVIEKI